MSQITFAEKASAPDTPAANKAVLYFNSSGDLCAKDDAGNVLTIAFSSTSTLTVADGSWTPVLSDAASGGNTATIATNYGTYVKVGKIVTVSFRCSGITTTGMTAGNALNIQALPFTSQNNANYRAFGSLRVENITFAGDIVIVLSTNTTVANISENNTGAATTNITVGDLTSGTANILGTLTYIAES